MFKRLIAFVLATALCGASASVLAQSHGGGHSGGGHNSGGGGWHGGGGNWSGGQSGGNWNGGHSGGSWHGGGTWHGGNNWHGGSWHGGHGYWHNGRWVSVAIGAPFFYWGWPYYYPYYDDPYYYAPAYTYYPAPNAVYLDSPSGETQPYPAPPQRSTAPRGQYYCPDSGYYPSVQSCPKGWLRVVPEAPPAQ
jgi:hypothetical protein